MRVNSVIFKFAFDDVNAIDKAKKVLGDNHLNVGDGTKIFLMDGQLAIQFFSSLSKPTPEQKMEFDKTFSSIKEMGNLLKGEEIKWAGLLAQGNPPSQPFTFNLRKER